MEGTPIPQVHSVASAARSLDRNPHRVKGWVEGLGIELTPVGTGQLMSEEDFQKLVKLDAKLRKQESKRSPAGRPAAATA